MRKRHSRKAFLRNRRRLQKQEDNPPQTEHQFSHGRRIQYRCDRRFPRIRFMHQLQLAQGHPQSGGHTLHQVVYLGSDLLLHYERNSGRYALLSFMRCRPADGSADSALTNATVDAPAPRCAISTTPLASGTLKPGAIHSYLGDGYLLAHFPHIEDAYELVRVVRPDDGRFYATSPPADDSAAHNQTRVAVGDDAKSFGASTSITSSSGRTLPAAAAGAYRLERESGGRLPVLGSFSHDGRRQRRLTSLHDGKLLDYDKEDGSYRLMRLRHQPGSSARFETLSSGTLPSGALSGCAAHTSSVACLRAGGAQCGWCQASGTCVRGDTWGPCQRVPCMQPSCGLWHSPVGTFMPSDSEPTQQRENATSPPAV